MKILLGDDSQPDGILLRICLAEIGCVAEVEQAIDGERILALVEAAAGRSPFPFRLIILDLNLPRIDGIELLRRIRLRRELDPVPLIVMTSSTNPVDRRRAEALKPTAFIEKASDYRGMLAIVERLVEYLGP
jgi:CheY-like chemotaxis protein